ncbi:hypothetical protein [Rhodoflexus sp.]
MEHTIVYAPNMSYCLKSVETKIFVEGIHESLTKLFFSKRASEFDLPFSMNIEKESSNSEYRYFIVFKNTDFRSGAVVEEEIRKIESNIEEAIRHLRDLSKHIEFYRDYIEMRRTESA